MELTLDQALQKGIEAHKAGKAQEADRYYTAILKANPKHPDANHNMGVLAVGVGKIEEALPFFKTALEINPNIAQFWLSYIDALIKLDRMEEAKDLFGKAKNNNVQGETFNKLEKRLMGSDKGSEVNSARKPLEPPADQLQILINLFTRGDFHKVFEHTKKLTQKYPENLILWNLMGPSAAQIGYLDEALIALNRAIKINPKYIGDAYSGRGYAKLYLKDYKGAISDFTEGLKINPKDDSSYHNRGVSRESLGKCYEAISDYIKAIELKADRPTSYHGVGYCKSELGDYEGAKIAFSKAIELDPKYADAYYNRGDAKSNLKD